jgi:hypothetical protein
LLAAGVALLALPPYAEYCESRQSHQYYCAAYEVALAVGAFVESHNGAITALASAVVAMFTWTLWNSSEKMWLATKRSADIAFKTLHAANQPVLLLTEVDIQEPSENQKATRIVFSLQNSGNGVADIKKLSIEIRVALLRDSDVHRRRDTLEEDWNAAIGSRDVSRGHAIRTRLLTAQDVANIRAGKSQIALIFVIYFTDVLGVKYEAGFPMIYDHRQRMFMRTTMTDLNAQDWGDTD